MIECRVYVAPTPDHSDFFLYLVGVNLVQDVQLVRDPKIVLPGQTWVADSGVGGDYRANLHQKVQEAARGLVERFINDYMAANPGLAVRAEPN